MFSAPARRTWVCGPCRTLRGRLTKCGMVTPHSVVLAIKNRTMSSKKRRIDALGEAIEQAKAELDEREASLERREEQLKKAIEGVDHEKKLMAGRAPSDVLQLNIGGSHCSVSRRTLCQYEPSLLAAKFSGRWDDNVEKDADGRFFIDQPSQLFMPLVDFRYEPYDNPNPNLNQASSLDFRY